jgi:succinyl-CoA synthetase beta subunit
MARVKLTEYRAKKIILGDSYRGISLPSGKLSKSGRWVAKVDQGVKKRFKQGLVAVDVSPAQAAKKIGEWKKKGFSQFLLEPFVPHKSAEEQYLALERVREGIRVLHAKDGGIDIEAHPETVQTYLIRRQKDIVAIATKMKISSEFLGRLYETFDKYFFAFLEINPLVVRGKSIFLLDAAVLVDSAGSFFVREGWSEADIVKTKAKHRAEENVEKIAATTAASLKLSVLNQNGSLFFLLSGGGGSIVIADEAQLVGAGSAVGNYGEYSGGPTREETYLYAKEVIGLLLHSRAKKKALVIAGGVANFTDVRQTFAGIIDALSEVAEALRRQKIKIFVRRGGPNEVEGLALMREFLQKEKLLGSIHGSDAIITTAVDNALKFVNV